ncbi:MAG: DMT family transporter [Candidatus Electryonea clarkiae]|nr:DMT family transporter [Candidatus Electryonea clarkiae]MDP8286385.1 DMT family transporter [Candidatus Electryonea clarkiae]
MRREQKSYAVAGVFFAVMAYAWAAILIRWAEPAHPLAIAFWRVFIAAIVMTPFYWIGNPPDLPKTTKRQYLLMLLAGLFLCFHFATWITSLSYTTVATAVFLILLQPIFIAIAAHWLLQEHLNRWNIGAMLITVMGALLICGGDFQFESNHLFGSFLAFIGAIGSAGYLFIARVARPDRMSQGGGVRLNRYLPPVYWVAAIGMLIVCLVAKVELFPFPAKTWISLISLALIPTVIGHSLFNWALRYLPAFSVNISIVGEPVGASLLAFFLLAERPSAGLLIGAPLMILAVILVMLRPPGAGNVTQ